MVSQSDLLRQSFQQIEPYGEAFMASMYRRLFTLYPDISHFFANACMEEQQRKLLMFFVFVLEHLDEPGYLAGTLQRLGQIHSHYQVGIEHFEKVGTAFVATFAEYLGSAWTPLHQAAWKATYYQLTTMMFEGYKAPATTLDAGR